MLETLSRKSDTSRAILYALNRWEALTRYCDDGQLEIDNLAVERALRGVAIGRRNYLFAGADSGGERAAVIYSLIGTAKLNGVDPEAYLRHVLGCIADHPINRMRSTTDAPQRGCAECCMSKRGVGLAKVRRDFPGKQRVVVVDGLCQR